MRMRDMRMLSLLKTLRRLLNRCKTLRRLLSRCKTLRRPFPKLVSPLYKIRRAQ